jgi:hypothetical protein
MSAIDNLATQILGDVVDDFLTKNLGSDALNEEYTGVPLVALEKNTV